ncbi:MAG: hypothetical protein ABH834_06835 [Candidatus Altiarchaeota archaeon]
MPLNDEHQDNIIEFLQKTTMGASSTEIAKAAGISRPTLIKYLGIMKVQGIVDYKKIGMAKLWYLPRELELPDLLKDKDILSVLKRDKKTSGITLFGRPRIIIPARFIYVLTTLLTKKQQEEIFMKITLQRIKDYEEATDKILDECSPKEVEEFIKLWVRYRMKNGWGRLKDLKLDHDNKRLSVTLYYSEVADAVKTYSPTPPKEAACNLLSGVFLGFMQGAFKKTTFTCTENTCTAKNDAFCQFTVKPKK